MVNAILQTEIPNVSAQHGKVRDIYNLGDQLLIVASDRISAFDVIMTSPIPYKGIVLTQISRFWFDFLADTVENHLISTNVGDFPARRMRYQGLPRRFRLEGLPGHRHRLRSQAARRPEAMPETTRTDFHTRHQGRNRRAR